jgi:hypothetical protein
MAADEIDDQLQAAPVSLGQQAVEGVERAHPRIDRPVVGDVVAEVFQRRCKERRQPEGVNSE